MYLLRYFGKVVVNCDNIQVGGVQMCRNIFPKLMAFCQSPKIITT